MDGMYAECSVKKKKGFAELAKKLSLIMGSLLLILIFHQFHKLGIVTLSLFLADIGVIAYFWRYSDVEYEYVFCDGQLDFDVIYAGKKRKHILRVDLENTELLAPKKDKDILGFKDAKTVCDYTSKEVNTKVYALIVKKNDRYFKIYFEPNEKILKSMKYKIPRKIRFYEE